MKYFKRFPNTFDIDARLITNITKNVLISKNLKNASQLYYTYKLEDGERPDNLAFKLYADESLQWIIALINDWLDPRTTAPLTYAEMQEYLIQQYGTLDAAQTTIHHYEDAAGEWVNAENTPNIAVYCDQWEERQNEARREIKVVRKEYVEAFQQELKKALKV